MRHLPTVFSVSRLALGLVLLAKPPPPSMWPVLFGGAALSDFADGWLARRLGAASALGGTIDIVADGAFFLGADVCLWRHGQLPGFWFGLILLLTVPQLACQAVRWHKGLEIASVGLAVDKALGAYCYAFVIALALGLDPHLPCVAHLLLQGVANGLDLHQALKHRCEGDPKRQGSALGGAPTLNQESPTE